MRRIIAWCIGGLPFDPRSQRAIDETLADWSHEQHEAPTRGRRTLASIHGLLSVARVVSIALVREATDFSWCRGLGRRCGFIAGLVTLMAAASVIPMVDGLGAGALTLVPLGMPLTLLAIMPPAIFLTFAWRPISRGVPTVGAVCLLALAALALAGWLVPLSSDLLNDVLRQSLSSAVPSDPDSRLSFSEAALAVTGWTSLAGASAMSAAMWAQRSPLRSRWWLVSVPAIYAALIPLFTFAIGASFLVFRSAGDPPVGFRPGIAAWTTSAVMMAVAWPRRLRNPF